MIKIHVLVISLLFIFFSYKKKNDIIQDAFIAEFITNEINCNSEKSNNFTQGITGGKASEETLY
jgi:hypothetical protein